MNNTFLSDFIMITNFKTIAFIIVLIAILFGVNIMAKKKVKFSTRMIVSTIAGLVLGIIIQLVAGFPNNQGEVQWINEVNKWYGLVGYGFMDLLKMLVVPLIFVSIIRVIINMKDGENLGKLTTRSLLILLGTTTIAAIVGIIVGNLFKLGVSANVVESTSEIREITPVVDTLRGLLPSNIVESMANGNVIAIVIFATFIGLSIRRLKVKKFDKVYAIKDRVDFIDKKNIVNLRDEAEKSFIDYFVWNYFVGYQRLENIEYELKKLKKEFNNIFYRILDNKLISMKEKLTLFILYISPNLYNKFIINREL